MTVAYFTIIGIMLILFAWIPIYIWFKAKD